MVQQVLINCSLTDLEEMVDRIVTCRLAEALRPPDVEYISIKQYAARFGVSLTTVNRMIKDGSLDIERNRRRVTIKITNGKKENKQFIPGHSQGYQRPVLDLNNLI